MAAGDKIKWEDANFKWNDAIPGNIYTWDDVKFLEELVDGHGATADGILWHIDQADPEKKKRFIRLVCKVKGIETYSGQKTIKTDDIDITVKDVELVIKEVLGKSITVENINV